MLKVEVDCRIQKEGEVGVQRQRAAEDVLTPRLRRTGDGKLHDETLELRPSCVGR